MKNWIKILVIVILIVVILIGIVEIRNLTKKENNDVGANNLNTNQENAVEPEIQEDNTKLEEFYIPLFIASVKDGEEQSVINSYIYEFNLKKEDNSKYDKYKDDDTVSLYSKTEVETLAQELFLENSNHIIQSMDFDNENNLYLMYGNDAYIPYKVTIKNIDKQENNNYQIDFEYIEFFDGEYIDFAEEYKSKHNITDDQEEEYSDKISKEYSNSKEKKSGKITLKKNENSETVQYQFVNIEI